MASKHEIKQAIFDRVNGSQSKDYSVWTIGITTDPATRKEAHGNPTHWVQWQADSLDDARDIETFFLNEFPKEESKRMKGGTGGDMNERMTAYVYIF